MTSVTFQKTKIKKSQSWLAFFFIPFFSFFYEEIPISIPKHYKIPLKFDLTHFAKMYEICMTSIFSID